MYNKNKASNLKMPSDILCIIMYLFISITELDRYWFDVFTNISTFVDISFSVYLYFDVVNLKTFAAFYSHSCDKIFRYLLHLCIFINQMSK